MEQELPMKWTAILILSMWGFFLQSVLSTQCTSRVALFRKLLQILNLPVLELVRGGEGQPRGIYFSNFQNRTPWGNFQNRTGWGNIWDLLNNCFSPSRHLVNRSSKLDFSFFNSVRIYRFLAWLQNRLSQAHSLPNTPSSTFNKRELEEQMAKGHPFHVALKCLRKKAF